MTENLRKQDAGKKEPLSTCGKAEPVRPPVEVPAREERQW